MPLAPCLKRYVVGTLAAITVASATTQTKPPAPPVRNVTDAYFGIAVLDHYRYFEDLKDPEVAGWMKAEAEYTRARGRVRIPVLAGCRQRLPALRFTDHASTQCSSLFELT